MFKRIVLASAFILGTALWCTAAPVGERTVFTQKRDNYRLTARTNAPHAAAKIGEAIVINITIDSQGPGSFRAEVFVNGIRKGEPREFKFGKGVEFTETLDAPGEFSVRCSILDENKKSVLNRHKQRLVLGFGVIVAPEKIVPGNPKRPEDFDAFWKAKREELDKVPVKATRTEIEPPVKERKKYPGVVCYDVKVDCAGSANVTGYLCMPRDAKPKSLPAIVEFNGASTFNTVLRPNMGTKAIFMNVNAHGLPNGKPAKFYRDAREEMKSYKISGFGSRDSIYFVGMYMRVMRALDYMKSLPEWDGKNLIVRGGSQGGAQSLAAAALDPQVSLCVAQVPALCDLGGALAGRRPGWPIILMPEKNWKKTAVIGAGAYVDNVFMAQRIKCPIYISTGLIDNICVATSVCAAYNALPEGTKKHLTINPCGDHGTSISAEGAKAIKKVLGK